MHKRNHIAVVCNYQLKDNRIGSMDRFFLAFNSACKNRGYIIDWFFPKSKQIELYNGINLYSDNDSCVETIFFKHLEKTKTSYNYVFTHFIELFTPFYKKVKKELDCKIFAIDHMSRPIDGFPIKKKIKRKIKYLVHRNNIDKIIAVSQYIKSQNLKDYSSNLKNKIEVIYNGIDTELYKNYNQVKTNGSSHFKFIVVSHLVYEKGIQDLISSLSKLDKQTLNKIKVDIFGEGIYKAVLQELIIKYNLEHIVNLKGSIANVYNMYKNYDYMIQPAYMEAFSLSILESLFNNVPVITTKVGGNVEIIKDGTNGYLFEAKDINELKEILVNICDNNMTLNESNIYEGIRKEYALDVMVNNYLKLM